MAQKSGFFNARLEGGVYDRKYNADDYSDNLAVIIASGVLRSANDDLKVTASGLNLTVKAGRAWIKGHYYNNTTDYSLPAVIAPTGGSRIDRVVLRFDNSIGVRAITIEYVQGTAATSPVAPALTRNDTTYDLCLAEITVAANASSVSVEDTRSNADICGWVYSTSGDNSFFTSLDNSFNAWFESVKDTLASVTLFKRYKWETTLGSAASTVTFNIPQYDADTCFIEVYVNGMLADDYTQSGSTITFTTQLVAGTEITVLAFKSIDGTGIMSVADEITELQNAVAALDGDKKYTYIAGNNASDNAALSDIAKAFFEKSMDNVENTAAIAFLTALGGDTYLSTLPDNAHITISVIGKLNIGAAVYGSGTTASRYRYFNLSQAGTNPIHLTFDFAKAETISVTCEAGTSNIIFYGTDLDIRNASVYAVSDGAGCDIQMIAGSNVGRINAENCRFDILCSGEGRLAAHGTYINCNTRVRSEAGHALSFVPKSENLIRVIGGTHLAYAVVSGKTAAVFYTYGTETNAVIMATNINCPTVSITGGFWQQYLSVGYAGKTLIDCVTSTMNSAGNYNIINNQIWLSKAW